MKEKRNQTKIFDQKDFNGKRSKFDLSYPNKMTLNFNELVPTLAKPTMPGDSWHIHTDIFSRWLAMEAPTFSEYSIKFLHAFVANNMIYGGWQQFIGQGDDQASQYLLPAENVNLNGLPLPHITTRDVACWYARKIVDFRYTGYVGIYAHARKFFRLFALPLLSLPAKANNGMTFETFTPDGELFNYENIEVVPTLVIGSTMDNDYWDSMVSNGYVYELTDYNEENPDLHAFFTDPDGGGARVFDWTFYCYGANLGIAEKYLAQAPAPAYIELPKNVFFPLNGFDYALGGGTTHWFTRASLTKANATAYDKTRFFPHYNSVYATTAGLINYLPHAQYVNGYIPFGYVYDVLPSELRKNEVSTSYTTLSWYDIYYRTIGQHIVLQLFGRGTLSDYIGKCMSNSLLRQPFSAANAIFGNVTVIEHGYNTHDHPVISGSKIAGTYNEKSAKFEIGVVNDVPISLLPYLAYHKIWSDRIRDNRYELRCIYSDPYKSPFMRPLQNVTSNAVNGQYVSGNCWKVADDDNYYHNYYGFYPNGFGGTDAEYMEIEEYTHEMDYTLTPEKPFNPQSLVMLLGLRKRRVVHDFFTMVTPTSQYGDPAVANLDSSYEGQQGISVLALRMATRLQKFLERSNFVGSDFVKQTLAHFGVKPEHCNHCSVRYLGGKVMKPTISPVTQTSSNNDDTNQVLGQQSAQMYCSGNLGKVDFSCNEHGYIFQLATIQNDFFTVDGAMVDPINYFDYPLPEFADLGPEALPLQRVVQTDGTPTLEGNQTHPLSVFGYIPRYGQWKCSLAEIHGDFRNGLSYWVSKRQLDPDLLNGSFGYGRRGNTPQIGEAFLYENADYNAFVYSGEDYHHALFDINHRIVCSRLLPMLPSPNVL